MISEVTVEKDFTGYIVRVRIYRKEDEPMLEILREASKALMREVVRNEGTNPGRNFTR